MAKGSGRHSCGGRLPDALAAKTSSSTAATVIQDRDHGNDERGERTNCFEHLMNLPSGCEGDPEFPHGITPTQFTLAGSADA